MNSTEADEALDGFVGDFYLFDGLDITPEILLDCRGDTGRGYASDPSLQRCPDGSLSSVAEALAGCYGVAALVDDLAPPLTTNRTAQLVSTLNVTALLLDDGWKPGAMPLLMANADHVELLDLNSLGYGHLLPFRHAPALRSVGIRDNEFHQLNGSSFAQLPALRLWCVKDSGEMFDSHVDKCL